MSAMRAIAHVIEENYAKVCIGAHRFGKISTIQILVATRFKHHSATILICVLFQPGAPFDDGYFRDPRKTLRHKSECFTARMQLNCT